MGKVVEFVYKEPKKIINCKGILVGEDSNMISLNHVLEEHSLKAYHWKYKGRVNYNKQDISKLGISNKNVKEYFYFITNDQRGYVDFYIPFKL